LVGGSVTTLAPLACLNTLEELYVYDFPIVDAAPARRTSRSEGDMLPAMPRLFNQQSRCLYIAYAPPTR